MTRPRLQITFLHIHLEQLIERGRSALGLYLQLSWVHPVASKHRLVLLLQPRTRVVKLSYVPGAENLSPPRRRNSPGDDRTVAAQSCRTSSHALRATTRAQHSSPASAYRPSLPCSPPHFVGRNVGRDMCTAVRTCPNLSKSEPPDDWPFRLESQYTQAIVGRSMDRSESCRGRLNKTRDRFGTPPGVQDSGRRAPSTQRSPAGAPRITK